MDQTLVAKSETDKPVTDVSVTVQLNPLPVLSEHALEMLLSDELSRCGFSVADHVATRHSQDGLQIEVDLVQSEARLCGRSIAQGLIELTACVHRVTGKAIRIRAAQIGAVQSVVDDGEGNVVMEVDTESES